VNEKETPRKCLDILECTIIFGVEARKTKAEKLSIILLSVYN